VTDETSWTEVFTSVFEAPSSSVEARIWAEVYGDNYPAELEPYSFTTRSELRRIVDGLALSHGDLMIDIGCGRGGQVSGWPPQPARPYSGSTSRPPHWRRRGSAR
jgi:hypothetical protein